MTPEQIATLNAIGDSLRANPMPWDQIPAETKAQILALMRPNPSFDSDQLAIIRKWWVLVSDQNISDINLLLPANTVLNPRLDPDGVRKWLSADIITDAAGNGPLKAILPILQTLQMRSFNPTYWET